MDFTFINWSEHLFAGFDIVEMQDLVSLKMICIIVSRIYTVEAAVSDAPNLEEKND